MRILVLMAFFVSGFTSLVLETLWVRMFTLVFGGTTLAIVTVLTAFMGGLALGSFLAGRVVERLQRHVMLYGILEISIAIYALVLPFAIDMLPAIYRWLPETWPFLLTALIRFVLCVLLLLLPTTLMGATLPLLSHFFVRRRSLIGFDVGLLYSTNTFGAVVGTVTGGFFLLPMWGHQQTLWSACGFLGVVALCMIALGKKLGPSKVHIPDSIDDEPAETQDQSPEIADFSKELDAVGEIDPLLAQRISLICIALTGATAMICQVIWSRALAMVIGSSTYAFTLILTIFLLGLAGGALLGSWTARRSWDIARSWSFFLLSTGIAIALGSLLMDRLPYLFIALVFGLPKKTTPAALFALKAAVAAVPIIIPTLLMGAFFPMALALFTKHTGAVGRSVGRLYAANTLGSIIGSAATGFVIIPLLGLRGGLALCASCYLLCALWLATLPQRETQRPTQRLWAIALLTLAIGVWLLPSWNVGRMSLGQFRLSLLRRSATIQDAMAIGNVLFYKEGVSATVSVEGNKTHRALKVNGKTDASNIGDRSTQIGVAFLPLLLHGHAKDAAVVGWGSGMSAGTALQFPLQSVVAIELEPAVVEGARLMEPWNFFPQRDKRLQLVFNDGRNYLATTRRTFDVIVSVPSNPWMAGVANLFTTNYAQITKARLRPKGIFCQWVQIYELSTRNILSILKTLRSVYPYVRYMEIELDSYDTLLMASHHPIEFDLKGIQARLQQPHNQKLARLMKIKSAFDLLPRFMMGEKELETLLKEHKEPIPLNTDDHNLLEFTAPLDLVTQSSSNAGEAFRKQVAKLGRNFQQYARYQKASTQTPKIPAFWRQAIESHLYYGAIGIAAKLLKQHQPAPPLSPAFFRVATLVKLMDGKIKPPSIKPAPVNSPAHTKLYQALLKAKQLYEDDKDELCIAELEKVDRDKAFRDAYPTVLYYLAACHRYSDHYADALKHFKRYFERALKPKPTPAPTPTPDPTP